MRALQRLPTIMTRYSVHDDEGEEPMIAAIRLFAVLGIVVALAACADLSMVSHDGQPFAHGDPYATQTGVLHPRASAHSF